MRSVYLSMRFWMSVVMSLYKTLYNLVSLIGRRHSVMYRSRSIKKIVPEPLSADLMAMSFR